MKYNKGKDIIKGDVSGLSFVTKKNKLEVEKDIEECLEKQEEEIESIVQELHNIVNNEFTSIAEFKLFVFKNIELNSAIN